MKEKKKLIATNSVWILHPDPTLKKIKDPDPTKSPGSAASATLISKKFAGWGRRSVKPCRGCQTLTLTFVKGSHTLSN